MTNKKRLFTVWLVAVLVFSFAGCAEEKKPEKTEQAETPTAELYAEGNLFQYGLVPVKKDGKWGYLNKSGELAIPPAFDMAYAFAEDGFAQVTVDGSWGLIDTSGKFTVEPQFVDEPACSQKAKEGWAKDPESGKWGRLNRATGEWLLSPQFEDVLYYGDTPYCPASMDGKWGVLDESGNWVLKPRFDGIGLTSTEAPYGSCFAFDAMGLVEVCIGEKWGYVNKNDQYAIAPQLTYTTPFNESGVAVVRNEQGCGVINSKGEWVFSPQFEGAEFVTEDLIVASTGEGRVLLNANGEWVIQTPYDHIGPFSDNGLADAVAVEGGKAGYINEKGEWAIPPQFDGVYGFNESGVSMVEKDGKLGLVNEKGEWMCDISADVWYIEPFSDGLWLAYVGIPESMAGVLDEKGEWVLPPEFDYIRTFNESGLAIVGKESQWGVVNQKCEYVLELRPGACASVQVSNEGFLIAITPEKTYVMIDVTTGKQVGDAYESIGENGYPICQVVNCYNRIEEGDFCANHFPY